MMLGEGKPTLEYYYYQHRVLSFIMISYFSIQLFCKYLFSCCLLFVMSTYANKLLYIVYLLWIFILCFFLFNNRSLCWFVPICVSSYLYSYGIHMFQHDSVQDSYEEQEFWMTRLDWVGTRLNHFEMFEEHENCLSRWKKCCSRWKQCWMKTMYK